jgi:hypothetical protein
MRIFLLCFVVLFFSSCATSEKEININKSTINKEAKEEVKPKKSLDEYLFEQYSKGINTESGKAFLLSNKNKNLIEILLNMKSNFNNVKKNDNSIYAVEVLRVLLEKNLANDFDKKAFHSYLNYKNISLDKIENILKQSKSYSKNYLRLTQGEINAIEIQAIQRAYIASKELN